MPKQYALDSEYRRRWQEFVLSDGTVFDSRQINWRQVKWDEVVKLITHIEKKTHIETSEHPEFKFFMNFRWGGREQKFIDGKSQGYVTTNIWTVGWTDGTKAHLTDIDFYTGNILKGYGEQLTVFKSHIHPACWKLITTTKPEQSAMMG